MKDEAIAKELRVPTEAVTRAKEAELHQLRAMGAFTMVPPGHPVDHGSAVVVGTKWVM